MRLNWKCYLVHVPGILFNKSAEWAISKAQREGRHSLYAIYDAFRKISEGIYFGNLYIFLQAFPFIGSLPSIQRKILCIIEERRDVIISNRKYTHFDDERKSKFSIFWGTQEAKTFCLRIMEDSLLWSTTWYT